MDGEIIVRAVSGGLIIRSASVIGEPAQQICPSSLYIGLHRLVVMATRFATQTTRMVANI